MPVRLNRARRGTNLGGAGRWRKERIEERKEVNHDQQRRATPRRTVSVVNVRDTIDALGGRGREAV
jgi:hypothetical protein